MFRKLLKIKKLADRAAPAREEHLVQVVRLLRRPALERGLVSRDGGEVVPDPPQHGLGLLDAAEMVREDGPGGRELVLGLGG